MPTTRTVTATIGHLKLALDTAQKAADLSSVPIVSPVIQLASALLDVVESVRTNKEDCKSLANNVVELVKAIVNSLSGKDGIDIDPDLKRQIEQLGSTLVEIKDKLTQISERSTTRRLLMLKADTDDIKGYKDRLALALQVFQVENNVSQRVLEATHHREVMTALTTHMPGSSLVSEFSILSEIPPAPAVFHGRDDYVALAVTLILTKSPARLAIIGAGGMGKTTVALAIIHDSQVKAQFGSSRYFIPCESVFTASTLLTVLLQILGVQHGKEDPLKCLLAFLACAGHLFLVLDNFETPWDSEDNSRSEVQLLLSHLAALKNVTLLITMRGSVLPNGLLWTQPALSHLTALDAEAARATYLAHCPLEDPNLDVLLEQLDYIPLAVTLMANIAQSDSCTPTALLATWKRYYTAMLKTSHADRSTNLDVSISLSIKSNRIQKDPEALQLLALICMLPDGVFIDQWPDISQLFENGDLAAQALRQTALAYKDTTRELQVLSPIRHYVQRHLQPPVTLSEKLQELYLQLATLGLHYSSANRNNSKVLIEESGNINKILLQQLGSNCSEEVVQAVIGFSTFLYWTYPSTDLLEACTKILSLNSTSIKAQCLQLLGNMQYILSQYSKALGTLTDCKVQCESNGDKHGVAQCLWSLGEVTRRLDQLQIAITHLTEAKVQFESIGDRHGAAQCLLSLAEIARRLDQNDKASTQLTEAKMQFETIGDTLGIAKCLLSLGDMEKMLNQYDKAIVQLTKAKMQFDTIEDKLGAAQCLQSLGDIARVTGQYDKASDQLEEAKALSESIGDILGATQCLQGLGNIARVLGHYDIAAKRLIEAKVQFENMEDKLGTAQCLQSLGNISRVLGQYTTASAQLTEAKVQFERIHDSRGVAQCLQSLGDVAASLAEYDKALSQLTDAKIQYERIGDRLGAVQCLQGLGDVARMLNQHDKATRQLTEAKIQFEGVGDRHGVARCLLGLGEVARMLDQDDKASLLLTQAHAEFQSIGDKLGAAVSLHGLGELSKKLREHDRAVEMLQEAKASFESMGIATYVEMCQRSLDEF